MKAKEKEEKLVKLELKWKPAGRQRPENVSLVVLGLDSEWTIYFWCRTWIWVRHRCVPWQVSVRIFCLHGTGLPEEGILSDNTISMLH